MNHYFDVDVATKYSVNIAIFLNNLAHWTVVNIANRKNYYDFRYWTYNSRRAFLELFPYWTDDQLRTVILNAIKSDLVIEGCYNSKGYDRTKWYSLSDKALALYKINPIAPTDQESSKNEPLELPNSSPASFGKNPNSTWEKSPMDLGEIPNALGKNPQPIPNSIPDDKPNTTTTRDQILNKNPDPEPVVVFTDSLTSTPKVNPLIPINRIVATTDIELLTAYRSRPIFSENILCEDDFLSACDSMIKDRGDMPLRGRIKGIVGWILTGNFEEPKEWAREQRNIKNRAKGEANMLLQEQATRKKAPITTKSKTKEECMKEIMENALKDKKETIIEPIYKESTFDKNSKNLKKQYKKIDPPENEQEMMFQPDMNLIEEDKKEEEELPEVWEARL
jgi:hypothetical protein